MSLPCLPLMIPASQRPNFGISYVFYAILIYIRPVLKKHICYSYSYRVVPMLPNPA